MFGRAADRPILGWGGIFTSSAFEDSFTPARVWKMRLSYGPKLRCREIIHKHAQNDRLPYSNQSTSPTTCLPSLHLSISIHIHAMSEHTFFSISGFSLPPIISQARCQLTIEENADKNWLSGICSSSACALLPTHLPHQRPG